MEGCTRACCALRGDGKHVHIHEWRAGLSISLCLSAAHIITCSSRLTVIGNCVYCHVSTFNIHTSFISVPAKFVPPTSTCAYTCYNHIVITSHVLMRHAAHQLRSSSPQRTIDDHVATQLRRFNAQHMNMSRMITHDHSSASTAPQHTRQHTHVTSSSPSSPYVHISLPVPPLARFLSPTVYTIATWCD